MRFLLVILKMSTSPTQSAAGAASHQRYGLTSPPPPLKVTAEERGLEPAPIGSGRRREAASL